MKTTIIIPTYNEQENIIALIDALQAQFDRMSHDMGILVVDDNSPDGTADRVRAVQGRYSNVWLITGEKEGLGAAYLRGMRYCMDELGSEVVFEMDADFSHRPEDVPRLMHEVDEGADFVIGSRYVRGGSIPTEWGLVRRLNSLYGNVVARYVAGIYRVRDCTAGFRAIRVPLLRDIDFDALRVKGYAFQVALLHEAVIKGAKVVEIPVDFVDRAAGESKLGIRDIIEFILNAWWIRLRTFRTFIKFALVGLSGVVVNLGSFTLLLALGMNKYLASPVAIELSIIWNFLLNNYWTFRWRRTKDRARIKGLKFNIVSLLALGVSYSVFVMFSQIFPDLPPQWGQLVGILPAMLVNYMLNTYWTFRDTEPEPS